MTWLKDLKIGDSVFLVPSSQFSNKRIVEVNKVGRKWITLGDYAGRVDINQQLMDGSAKIDQNFGSPDRIYRSQEAFDDRMAAAKLRRDVYEAVVVHGDLTDDQITEIANLIGITGKKATASDESHGG